MTSQLTSAIIASSLGALLGLTRQWIQQQKHVQTDIPAGMRTFILWALLGFSCALAPGWANDNPYILPSSFVAFAGYILGYQFTRVGSSEGFGLTTASTAMLTFWIGAMVAWQQTQMAVLITILAMLVLHCKHSIHKWSTMLTAQDAVLALQFAAISGVILPLVPNRVFQQVFNPHDMWLMVVLISGLGFVGYTAMRFLGAEAGIMLTGIVGGLASSTATTLAFSRSSRDNPSQASTMALAVVTACGIMLIRVLAVIAIFNQSIAYRLLLPFTCMLLPSIVFVAWVLIQQARIPASPDTITPPKLENPLGLRIALKFGILYAVVAAVLKLMAASGSSMGIYAVGFLSGLTDMDAIAISSAQSTNLPISQATTVIVVATLANTVTKGSMAVALGHPLFAQRIRLVMGLTLIAGIASLLYL